MTRAGKMLLSFIMGCAALVLIFSARSWQRSRHQTALLGMAPKERGVALIDDFGCLTCHQPSSSYRAPILGGLLGKTRHLADGTSLIIDEAYLRESIVSPKVKLAEGYQDVMPSFADQISPEELEAIVEALK